MPKNIKVGQCWLVEGGCIYFVTGRNPDDTSWLGNRFETRGGITEGVAVALENFERQIDPLFAKEVALRYAEEKISCLMKSE